MSGEYLGIVPGEDVVRLPDDPRHGRHAVNHRGVDPRRDLSLQVLVPHNRVPGNAIATGGRVDQNRLVPRCVPGGRDGPDTVGHLGIAGVDQAASLEMLVFQHEVVGYVERVMRSFGMDDERLGLDVIAEVGPGGSFIDHEHTAAHFREELWMPALLDRAYWAAWEEAGRPALASKLPGRLQEFLNSYVEKPLPGDLSREFDKILAAAKKHLAK